MYFSHMLNKQCSSSSSFEKAEYVTFQIKSLMCKACIQVCQIGKKKKKKSEYFTQLILKPVKPRLIYACYSSL